MKLFLSKYPAKSEVYTKKPDLVIISVEVTNINNRNYFDEMIGDKTIPDEMAFREITSHPLNYWKLITA